MAALCLSACGASVIAADDVATESEDRLELQIGVRPDISCPDELEAEVGAEVRCTLTAEDDPTEYGVTVSVTSVDGDDAQLDIQVDDEPQG